MNPNLRRSLLGLVIGLMMAIGEIFLISIGDSINGVVSLNDTGSLIKFLAAGGALGIAYALLFRPRPGGAADDAMGGLVLGVVTWIILSVNIFPLLEGRTPLWEMAFAGELLPRLIALIIQGLLVGLVYGLVYRPLDLHKEGAGQEAAAKPVNIVVIGGGYAGVSAAEALETALAGCPHVTIWLISQTNYLIHTPMLSEVSASAVNAQNISPPLRSFFHRVNVVQGDVAKIDWAAGRLRLKPLPRTSHREIPFDQLLVTAGGVPNYFGNRAVEKHTLTFKSLEDSIRLRSRVIDLFERADFEPDPVRKRQMLTFVVVGGGFAGVELIGGLNDFGRGMLPNFPHIQRDDVRFVLIHTRDVILPELSEELGRFAQTKMEARGVEFWLNTRVTGAREGVCIMGDREIAADTVVWTAGNRPSPIVDQLGVELTRRGQIPVEATLRSVERANLWAAGDCAQIPVPDQAGQFYPPTAQHALREGKLLGKNVAAAIRGKPLEPFKFKTLGSLAALGHQLAVAEIFGMRFSGFLAWLMWRGIYLSKLPNFEKQLRVFLDWVLDVFFPPDIVQTIRFEEPTNPEESP